MTEITVNLSTTPDMIFSFSFRSLAVCDILHKHFLINGIRCYPSSNGSRSHLAVAVRRHEGQSVFICLVSDVRVLWESRRADLFQLFLNAVKVRKHNLKFKFESMVGIVASMEEDKKTSSTNYSLWEISCINYQTQLLRTERSDLQSAHRPHTVLGHASY